MKNRFMKHSSRILAMILAASMVISLGADVTSATNVYAAESTEEVGSDASDKASSQNTSGQSDDSDSSDEKTYYCGKTAHTHTDDCYETEEVTEEVKICEKSEHEHSDDCYATVRGDLTCTEAEHTHGDDCYDEEGNLTCEESEHEHSDDCYESVRGDLTCTEAEHTHGDDCYETRTVTKRTDTLDCDKEEHTHTDACETKSTTPKKGPAKVNTPSTIAETDSEPYDFTKDITGAKFEYNNGGGWQDITNATVLKLTDQFAVTINFTLPAESVTTSNTKIQYKLPDALSNFTGTGTVYSSTGEEVGQYEISNGTVIITINDSYAKKNADGSPIVGKVTLGGKGELIKTDDQGQATITIKDGISQTITVDRGGNISVSKSHSDENITDGTLKYTITVTSSEGTFDKVTLTDAMTNIGLDTTGQFTVKAGPTNGTLSELTEGEDGWTKTNTGSGFTMTLPKMDAGTTYEITCYGKLPDNMKGENIVKTRNDVTVESKDSNNKEIKDTGKTEYSFTRYLKKSGQKNNDDTITWTITVNPAGQDIGGYKLSDALTNNGTSVDLTGQKVTINPAITLEGESQARTEVTLPITFPAGTKNTYTITYTTSYTAEYDKQKFVNTATLTKDDKSYEAKDDVEVTKPAEYKKEGTGYTLNDDKNTLTLHWKYSWTPSEDCDSFTIWESPDQSNGTHYFTLSQRNALKSQLEGIFGEGKVTMSSNGYTEIAAEDGTTNWTGIGIQVNAGAKQGTTYTITYDTTVAIPTTEKTYWNNISIDNKNNTNGHNTYEPDTPFIKKVDSEKDGDHTYYDYYDSNGKKKEYLRWNITLTIPASDRDHDYTIYEDLPSSDFIEKIDSLKVTVGSNQEQTFKASDLRDGQEVSVSVTDAAGTNYSITAKKTDGQIVIRIPKGIYAEGNDGNLTMVFKLALKLRTSYTAEGSTVTWESETSKDFANTVTVENEQEEKKGESTQTQTIKFNDSWNAVEKTLSAKDNILTYRVIVNPDGKKYLSDDLEDKTFQLIDELVYDYNPYYGRFTLTLVPNSVKVYKYDKSAENNCGDPITSGWKYTATETSTLTGTNIGDDLGRTWHKTLTFDIPDATPMVVEYKYKISSTATSNSSINITPKNTATLKGQGIEKSDKIDDQNVNYDWHAATMDAKGITIYKVDASDNTKYLKDAVFKLEKYNGTTWVEVKSLTSESDGHVDTGELTYNVAYRITETSAPSGYKVSEELEKGYTFYIVNSDKTLYPEVMPTDFVKTAHQLNDGQVIYLGNEYVGAYELPETGGSGTLPYTLGGLTAILFSLLSGGYVYRRKYICNK